MPISIPNPCSAQWSEMTATEKGRFCESCSKEVYDLTDRTTEEIELLLKNENQLCGKVKAHQLIPTPSPKKKLLHFFFALLICFGSTLFSLDAKAQRAVDSFKYQGPEKFEDVIVVKGKVTDEETGEPLPAVIVYFEINGTRGGVFTDIDGHYSLPIPKEIIDSEKIKVHFKYIGYLEKVVVIDLSSADPSHDRFSLPAQLMTVEVVGEMMGAVVVSSSPPLIQKTDHGKTTISGENLKRSLRH